MTRHAYIGGMIALLGLALAAKSQSVEYVVRARDEAKVRQIDCTDGRLKRGKGDKRRARRHGERWK